MVSRALPSSSLVQTDIQHFMTRPHELSVEKLFFVWETEVCMGNTDEMECMGQQDMLVGTEEDMEEEASLEVMVVMHLMRDTQVLTHTHTYTHTHTHTHKHTHTHTPRRISTHTHTHRH